MSLEDLENAPCHSGGIETIRETFINSYTDNKKTHAFLKNVLDNTNSLQKHDNDYNCYKANTSN
jgi:hypothetical protein